MAINSLDFKTKLSDELDKQLVRGAVTGFMADNLMRQKFIGAKTVLIPDLDMQGLGDYDRDEGFLKGSVTVDQKSYTLANDRARSFSIDREDMDETGIANLAGQIMGEFVRTKVVPEVDAYTLSKLCKAATTSNQVVTLGQSETLASNCLKLLSTAINKINDVTGYEEEIVVFVNPTVYEALMSTPELAHRLITSDFSKGEINTAVQKYNNACIIPVPAARMKTAYTFGTTGAGGFTADDDADDIGILALPKKAASLVKKTEKIRVFNPDSNVEMDAYKFDYRIYYDAFIKASMKDTVYAYVY